MQIRIVGSLMFARKVSAERIIEAFGMDPAAARLVPADGVSGALSHPLWMRITRGYERGRLATGLVQAHR